MKRIILIETIEARLLFISKWPPRFTLVKERFFSFNYKTNPTRSRDEEPQYLLTVYKKLALKWNSFYHERFSPMFLPLDS